MPVLLFPPMVSEHIQSAGCGCRLWSPLRAVRVFWFVLVQSWYVVDGRGTCNRAKREVHGARLGPPQSKQPTRVRVRASYLLRCACLAVPFAPRRRPTRRVIINVAAVSMCAGVMLMYRYRPRPSTKPSHHEAHVRLGVGQGGTVEGHGQGPALA
jgi:hypothetical protein